jgi:hypothetical protein
MRLKGNEEIMLKEFFSSLLILNPYEKCDGEK